MSSEIKNDSYIKVILFKKAIQEHQRKLMRRLLTLGESGFTKV